MVSQIISFCPCQEGNGQKLQKIHQVLNLPLLLFIFQHSKNFDAGRDKRLLKSVIKVARRRLQLE
jgi:thiosulfate reductase cytochrome b subunit